MLTVEDVAHHWKLRPETIRKRIGQGDIPAARLNRQYRLRWEDVWACERGPMPRGRARPRYMKPLLTKDQLGALYGVSTRTVERWVEEGLPTRNVFGSVRFNADDAAAWLAVRMGFLLGGSKVAGGGLRPSPPHRSTSVSTTRAKPPRQAHVRRLT